MENCPQLIFNSGYMNKQVGLDTNHLRSTLFKIMLEEVKVFCKQKMSWRDVESQVCLIFAKSMHASCDDKMHVEEYHVTTCIAERVVIKLTKSQLNWQ